jgi:uncharacterized membrane protein YgaE (UPF0421/DUF939 family)
VKQWHNRKFIWAGVSNPICASRPPSLVLVKFAIKTAIATALLGAIFQNAHLVEHLAYPAMGLITTMQPSLGPTVKKTWGRLAGSAIGGMIGACVVLTLGTSPITVGLAFVLAALVCELFQFQAATTKQELLLPWLQPM